MNTYKNHFANRSEAEAYDRNQYSNDSYSTLLWELERETLASLVREFRTVQGQIRYLDFAAGTGRIISFLESEVDDATAIEISPSMAERARARLQRASVLCRDITLPDSEIEGQYDLITAFRFFLNAEPSLRRSAMQALAARLRNQASWLIFNNHGNLWSLKILGWPYHRLRRVGKGWQPHGNYMRYSEVKRLLDDVGLRIVHAQGLGVLGGKVCGRFSYENAMRLESHLAEQAFLQKFGQDQIYVACRKAGVRV